MRIERYDICCRELDSKYARSGRLVLESDPIPRSRFLNGRRYVPSPSIPRSHADPRHSQASISQRQKRSSDYSDYWRIKESFSFSAVVLSSRLWESR